MKVLGVGRCNLGWTGAGAMASVARPTWPGNSSLGTAHQPPETAASRWRVFGVRLPAAPWATDLYATTRVA
jgi:hypothetical protein